MNWKHIGWMTAALTVSVLFGSCGETFTTVPPVPENRPEADAAESLADSFAEGLTGIYRSESEETGETILQVYRIDGMLIAEAAEEYAAYYATELIPGQPEPAEDGTLREMTFTACRFSGFSDEGAYWDSGVPVTIALTESGFDMTSADGTVTGYTRDDSTGPHHDPERYTGYFTDAPEASLTGEWTASTETGHTITLRLEEDGDMVWCSKKEGEPVEFHIGLASTDPDTGYLHTVTEKVGWGAMPWMYDMRYSFDADGHLLLENCEAEGLLPADTAVRFRKESPHP